MHHRLDMAEDLSDATTTAVIESASVDTRSEDREMHLHSADVFGLIVIESVKPV